MKLSHAIAATLLLSTTMLTAPAFAETDAAVLEQLKAMQEQMSKMQAQMEGMQKKVEAAEAKVASANEKAAKATEEANAAKVAALAPAAGKGAKVAEVKDDPNAVKVTLTPGPKFETADGNYSLEIHGFAQLDAAAFDDDKRDFADGTTVRRARLSVSGVIAKDWAYKFENDFANNASAVTDAYLAYNGFKPVSIMAGQFKEPFGLEQLTSDTHTSFLERASLITFMPDRNIGFQVATNGANWTATVGAFGANSGTQSTDDESRSVTGRVTFAPIADKENQAFLHLGVAGSYRIPDQATDAFRYNSRPLTNVVPSTQLVVDTGSITGSDDRTLLGLEAAGVYGPFSLQAEYMRADVDRTSLADVNFDGYYVEASYFLTGDTRNYSPTKGKFEMDKVKHPFSLKDGTWGAWQLVARYGNLDLNDGAIAGGEMKDYTFGVKWYPHERLRVMANYAMIDADNSAPTPNDSPNVWMLRTQFDF